MNDQHGLILGLYAAVAGVLLLAGYIYKTIRDYRERHKNPKLPFNDKQTDKKEDHHPPLVASSSR